MVRRPGIGTAPRRARKTEGGVPLPHRLSSCASMVCASAANGRDAHSAIARRRAPRARASASRAGLRDDALIAPAGDRSRSRVTTLLARVLNRVRVDDAAREDASPFGEARETARKTPILLSSSLAGETRASRMARADARRAARLSLARKKIARARTVRDVVQLV